MSKRLIQLLIFLLTPLLIVVGFSSWIIVGEKSEVVGLVPSASYVCYINSDEAEKRYTRIEKALEVANSIASESSKQIVYVKPGTNPTIYKDCTIGAYTTLCIPYNETTFYAATDKNATNFNWGALSDFADNDPSTYRKNQVTISKGVTITNNGTLQLGGVFGKKEAGASGIINGDYCEIMLEENAKIISTGNIECYGFIKETSNDNGSRLELKSGKIVVPFAVYDFKSGTLTLASYSEDIAPFNVYDIVNIQTLFRIHAGVEVTAEYRFEMSEQPFSGILVFIGANNAGLILKSGYIDFQYTSNTSSGTSKAVVEGQTIVTLNGKMDIGTIKISVSGYDMSSAKWFFPISYKLKIVINNGSIISSSNKVKFMPGSSLIINKGANANINNQFIFYPDNYTEATKTEYYYPDNLSRAKLINNGNLVIGSAGALGIANGNTTISGTPLESKAETNFIDITDSTDAIIEVYNTSSVSSHDDVTGSFLGMVHGYNNNVTGNPIAYITTDYVSSNRTTLGDGIYEGVTLSNGNKVWKEIEISGDPVTIDYYQVIDGDVSTFTGHGNATTGTIETGLSLSTPTKSGYIFKGWYLDQNGEQFINNGQLSGLTLYRNSTNGVLKVYAHWEKGKVVNIQYIDSNGDVISGANYSYQVTPGTTITLIDSSEIIISSDNSSSPTSKTKYSINNWNIDGVSYSLGSTYVVPLEQDDGSTIYIKMDGTVNIYYRAEISGQFSTLIITDIEGQISFSGDKNLQSITSTYYILYNSSVTVGTYGELGSWTVGKNRIITVSGGVTKSVTAKGDRNWGGMGSDSRTEGKTTFNMPSATITIKVS